MDERVIVGSLLDDVVLGDIGDDLADAARFARQDERHAVGTIVEGDDHLFVTIVVGVVEFKYFVAEDFLHHADLLCVTCGSGEGCVGCLYLVEVVSPVRTKIDGVDEVHEVE